MPLQLITPPSDESILAYLNSLPAYDTSEGVDKLLDVARRILTQGGYIWQGYVVPNGTLADITIAAGQTFTGTVAIPPGSLIYAINITALQPNSSTPSNGVRVRVYDKSAKSDFSSGRFLLDKTFAGQDIADVNNQSTDPTGPGFMLDPLFVMGPMGSLQVDIVNGDPANSTVCQILFCCAVPLNNVTANTPAISD